MNLIAKIRNTSITAGSIMPSLRRTNPIQRTLFPHDEHDAEIIEQDHERSMVAFGICNII